jgi:hypothetical protein
MFSTEEFKPPSDPEKWRYPGEPPVFDADADLARVHQERIAAPRDKKGNKRRR